LEGNVSYQNAFTKESKHKKRQEHLTWIRFRGDIQGGVIRKKLPKHVYEINKARVTRIDDTSG